MARAQTRRGRPAAALVETAAVVVVFLLVLFGIFEYCRLIWVQNMVENAGLAPEQARKKSDNDWALLLPKGRVPQGHCLFAVEDDETGERVGDLWFAERSNDFDADVAFVYSIEIFAPFRGRGFGPKLRLRSVSLHFGCA